VRLNSHGDIADSPLDGSVREHPQLRADGILTMMRRWTGIFPLSGLVVRFAVYSVPANSARIELDTQNGDQSSQLDFEVLKRADAIHGIAVKNVTLQGLEASSNRLGSRHGRRASNQADSNRGPASALTSRYTPID
jgi:hypothetical protein